MFGVNQSDVAMNSFILFLTLQQLKHSFYAMINLIKVRQGTEAGQPESIL